MSQILVEVTYIGKRAQVLKTLSLSPSALVLDAILQSKILEEFAEINLDINKVGIFGKLVSLETLLKNGDRVEIYRPLILNPKEARKLRVMKETTKK